MKINHPLSVLALGTALITTASWGQTTPTGTATSTTYPQGAITTDSVSAKPSRDQKRALRRNRKMTNQASNNAGTTTNTSPQDARYRKSSASDGTTLNNSNTTNYNSNNVTNAPTGVGSNPNEMTAPNSAGQSGNGQTNGSSTASNGGNSASTGTADSNAGSAEAVSGMKNSPEPAVKSGSTTRNTSIGDFISSSPNYVTLQNALQSADMWETLKGGGPYTLFAPTNAAFKKLSSNAQGALLDGSNRAALKQLLAYHVVSGTLSHDELSKQIKAGNGRAQLKTLSGATLTAQESNGRLTLTDEQGNSATVDAGDNRQANGLVYGIDGVLRPRSGVDAFR